MQVSILAASDAPRYRRLMLHGYEHAADAFTSTAQERDAEPDSWWVRRIADPEHMSVGFGAFSGEELVGAVSLEFSCKTKTKHKALVIGMYVLPAHRGRGAGRALLGAAIDHAKSRSGTMLLTLTVTQGNEAAIGLYRSLGFEVFGTEPMAIRTAAGFKAKLHMWRSIASEGAAA